jgi:hypothetical protein
VRPSEGRGAHGRGHLEGAGEGRHRRPEDRRHLGRRHGDGTADQGGANGLDRNSDSGRSLVQLLLDGLRQIPVVLREPLRQFVVLELFQLVRLRPVLRRGHERAVRWLIVMVVLCCDPLSLALTAAASSQRRRA